MASKQPTAHRIIDAAWQLWGTNAQNAMDMRQKCPDHLYADNDRAKRSMRRAPHAWLHTARGGLLPTMVTTEGRNYSFAHLHGQVHRIELAANRPFVTTTRSNGATPSATARHPDKTMTISMCISTTSSMRTQCADMTTMTSEIIWVKTVTALGRIEQRSCKAV